MQRVWSVFLVVVALAAAGLPVAPARAAGVVTNCASFTGPGSLSAAIATSGVVTFACSGTIALPSQIEVTSANSPLTIDGSGQNVILTGSGGTRLFRVGASRSLTLRNLTLRDGAAESGGAILAIGSSTLVLEGVNLLDNRAEFGGGAISLQSATASIRASRFEGNRLVSDSSGGAVLSIDTVLTIEASSFISNSAVIAGVVDSSGGALAFIGGVNDATISNSTFVSNTAAVGGAVAGSLILGDQSVIRLRHLTFLGNSATSGGTIATQSSSVRLANSVIAGPGPRCSVGSGTLLNEGGNWESGAGAASCGSPGPPVVSASDLALGSLGLYGGATPTLPIGSTSVARSSGVDAYCSSVGGVDQRGARRPSSGCSSGAYQFAASPVIGSLSPTQVTAGGPSFTLIITGTHFITGSTVRWNGLDLPTYWVGPTTLSATVPSSAIATAGSRPVTVRYPGPGDLDASATVEVVKASQSISVTPPGDRSLAAGPFTPTVSASSGLPVSLASTTPAVCTVTGPTIVPLAPGTCSITFSQAGNGTYHPAQDVVITFHVVAPSPTATPPQAATPTPTATPSQAATPTPTATRPPDLRPGTGGMGWLVPVVFADTRLNGEIVPFGGERR